MDNTRAPQPLESGERWIRRHRYLFIWAIGALAILLFRFNNLYQPFDNARSIQWRWSSWTLMVPPEGFLHTGIVFWTLLVAIFWLRAQVRGKEPAPDATPKRAAAERKTSEAARKRDEEARKRQEETLKRERLARRVDYVVLWLVGVIVIVNWGSSFLQAVTPIDSGLASVTGQYSLTAPAASDAFAATGLGDPTALDASDQFAPYARLSGIWAQVAIWTTAVLLLYLFLGDGSKEGFHADSLTPFRSILTTVGFVLLLTILANIFAYYGIQARVQSLEAPILLANSTASRLEMTSDRLGDTAQGLRDFIQSVSQSSSTMTDQQRAAAYRQAASGVTSVTNLATDMRDIADTAVLRLARAQQVEFLWTQGNHDPGLSSVWTVLEETRGLSTQLAPEVANLQDAAATIDPTATNVEAELAPLVAPLEAIASRSRLTTYGAGIASDALTELESSGTAIMLWLAAFYSSFVLFPWIILLMFLYRKRGYRAVEIVSDLGRLDESGGLLRRALGADDIAAVTAESRTQEMRSQDGQSVNRDPMGNGAMVDRLLDRAFGNREYVLSVTLLTVLIAAGWYYFLYPRADIGIADWVRADVGIQDMTRDLVAANASPLTMGFAGAYFFVTQMLLRRYLAGDLYPSAFLQAAVRIIWVFTLSVALAIMLPANLIDAKNAAIIAFVAGIFPREGFRLIAGAINGVVSKVLSWFPGFPTDIDVAPLSALDGINIWVESRLLEENVENVQGMATAPIEQLVVGTFYPAGRIVDWVDQAILYTHCGHRQEWCRSLRSVGIRTATDLLDSAGLKAQAARNDPWADFEPDATRLGVIATAANKVAAATPANETAQPNLDADVLGEMCKAMWPDPNLRYVQAYRVSTGAIDPPPTVPVPDAQGNVTAAGPDGKLRGNGHTDELKSPPTMPESSLLADLADHAAGKDPNEGTHREI